jgi:hypothetical protein
LLEVVFEMFGAVFSSAMHADNEMVLCVEDTTSFIVELPAQQEQRLEHAIVVNDADLVNGRLCGCACPQIEVCRTSQAVLENDVPDLRRAVQQTRRSVGIG